MHLCVCARVCVRVGCLRVDAHVFESAHVGLK